MYYLAPIALLLLASGALYQTNEIWDVDSYRLQVALRWGTMKSQDEAQLAIAVKRGIIGEEHKRVIMEGKWKGESQVAPHWYAQGVVQRAVQEHQQAKMKAVMSRNV